MRKKAFAPILRAQAAMFLIASYWGQTPISLRCVAPHPPGEPKARRIWALTPKTPSVYVGMTGLGIGLREAGYGVWQG